MTFPSHSPLYCPYLVQTFQGPVLVHEYCIATHKNCLVDDSALTRQHCTRRAWLDTCPAFTGPDMETPDKGPEGP